MDYIYDIVLNFQEKYYDFYEWHSSDRIINIKKIPIYKISHKAYLNLKNNDVTIDKNTLPKSSNMFLVTSGLEIMAIYINKEGRVIKRSSLIFEESDDILTDKEHIKYVNIKYSVNKTNNPNYLSRTNQEKITYINNYLNNIDKVKDEYLLKYLYFEIYNKEEKDVDKIYNKLIILANQNTKKIYEAIKKVNKELKKTS